MIEGVNQVKCGDYELTLVSNWNIPSVFPHVQEKIQEALDKSMFPEWDLDELYRRLLSGEAQLWLVGEDGVKLVLVAVTRIIRYPSVKRLFVDLIVGEDLKGCAIFMDVGAKWSRQFGCTEVEAACRPGVRKEMEKHGFVKAREVIIRPITGGLN